MEERRRGWTGRPSGSWRGSRRSVRRVRRGLEEKKIQRGQSGRVSNKPSRLMRGVWERLRVFKQPDNARQHLRRIRNEIFPQNRFALVKVEKIFPRVIFQKGCRRTTVITVDLGRDPCLLLCPRSDDPNVTPEDKF